MTPFACSPRRGADLRLSGAAAVLRDVSFAIRRGRAGRAVRSERRRQVDACCGCCSGCTEPASGQVILGGDAVGRLSRREIARRAALLPQDAPGRAAADGARSRWRWAACRTSGASKPERPADVEAVDARPRGDRHDGARRSAGDRAVGRRAAPRAPGARPRAGGAARAARRADRRARSRAPAAAIDLLRATVDGSGARRVVAMHDLTLAARSLRSRAAARRRRAAGRRAARAGLDARDPRRVLRRTRDRGIATSAGVPIVVPVGSARLEAGPAKGSGDGGAVGGPLRALAAAALVALAGPARADGRPPAPSATPASAPPYETVVRARPRARGRRARTGPPPASVVIPAERARARSTTSASLLLEVPGVTTMRTGSLGTCSTLSLRGSQSRRGAHLPRRRAAQHRRGRRGRCSRRCRSATSSASRCTAGTTPLAFGESALGGIVSITTRTPGARRADGARGRGLVRHDVRRRQRRWARSGGCASTRRSTAFGRSATTRTSNDN